MSPKKDWKGQRQKTSVARPITDVVVHACQKVTLEQEIDYVIVVRRYSDSVVQVSTEGAQWSTAGRQ